MDKKVVLWTPSFASTKADYNHGLRRLKELDVETIIPKSVAQFACKKQSSSRPFLAGGSDELKAQTLAEAWSIRDTQTLLATRGGYGALRLLPHLDKIRALSQSRKTLWGYSDLTVIQQYLHSRNGAPWVHSPMLSSPAFFAPKPKEEKFWTKILSGDEESTTQTLKVLNLSSKHRGKSELRVPTWGGNLASLITMMGTPWEFRIPANSWVFLEEVGEKAYRIDRMLRQLSYHKDFKNLRGVLLGHFTQCEGSKKVLQLWAEECDLSLVASIQAGHESPNIPLVLGSDAYISRKSQNTYSLKLAIPRFGVKL